MKIETDSTSLFSQVGKPLPWFVRLLAPQRISMPLFALLTGSVSLLLALSLGLGLGRAYNQTGWQVFIVTFLVLIGWAVGITTTILISRFTYSKSVGRNVVLWQAIFNILSYCGGAFVGVIFALRIRTMIPTLYPPPFPSFSLAVNIYIILIVVALWLILGLVSNHLEERAIRQREYQVALVKNNEELKESRRQIIAAQEALRQRIAEGLHCTVNDLFTLSLKLDRCQKNALSNPDLLLPELNRIKHELDRLTNEDLRNVIKDLRPAMLKVGLPDALRSILDHSEQGIEVRFLFDEEIKRLEDPTKPSIPDEIRLALYRFAEEAVRNVVKHAEATELTISMKLDANQAIELSIQDNGKGIERIQMERTGGISLMRYGIETVGGIFSIKSVSNQGTEVTARVPFKSVNIGRQLNDTKNT